MADSDDLRDDHVFTKYASYILFICSFIAGILDIDIQTWIFICLAALFCFQIASILAFLLSYFFDDFPH